MTERAAGAVVFLGDLDGHDAELEQRLDERLRNRRVLVHLPYEGPDLAVGELVDAVGEQLLVVVEARGARSFGQHGRQ